MRPIAFLAVLLLSTAALVAKTIDICTYECPTCHKVSEFAEDSAKIHKCSGDGSKKHSEISMTFKGKSKKEVK